MCQGDIGKDGKRDAASVLSDENTNNRTILIYTQNTKSEYECVYSDREMILSEDSGGVYGYPFAGVSIENGELLLYRCVYGC